MDFTTFYNNAIYPYNSLYEDDLSYERRIGKYVSESAYPLRRDRANDLSDIESVTLSDFLPLVYVSEGLSNEDIDLLESAYMQASRHPLYEGDGYFMNSQTPGTSPFYWMGSANKGLGWLGGLLAGTLTALFAVLRKLIKAGKQVLGVALLKRYITKIADVTDQGYKNMSIFTTRRNRICFKSFQEEAERDLIISVNVCAKAMGILDNTIEYEPAEWNPMQGAYSVLSPAEQEPYLKEVKVRAGFLWMLNKIVRAPKERIENAPDFAKSFQIKMTNGNDGKMDTIEVGPEADEADPIDELIKEVNYSADEKEEAAKTNESFDYSQYSSLNEVGRGKSESEHSIITEREEKYIDFYLQGVKVAYIELVDHIIGGAREGEQYVQNSKTPDFSSSSSSNGGKKNEPNARPLKVSELKKLLGKQTKWATDDKLQEEIKPTNLKDFLSALTGKPASRFDASYPKFKTDDLEALNRNISDLKEIIQRGNYGKREKETIEATVGNIIRALKKGGVAIEADEPISESASQSWYASQLNEAISTGGIVEFKEKDLDNELVRSMTDWVANKTPDNWKATSDFTKQLKDLEKAVDEEIVARIKRWTNSEDYKSPITEAGLNKLWAIYKATLEKKVIERKKAFLSGKPMKYAQTFMIATAPYLMRDVLNRSKPSKCLLSYDYNNPVLPSGLDNAEINVSEQQNESGQTTTTASMVVPLGISSSLLFDYSDEETNESIMYKGAELNALNEAGLASFFSPGNAEASSAAEIATKASIAVSSTPKCNTCSLTYGLVKNEDIENYGILNKYASWISENANNDYMYTNMFKGSNERTTPPGPNNSTFNFGIDKDLISSCFTTVNIPCEDFYKADFTLSLSFLGSFLQHYEIEKNTQSIENGGEAEEPGQTAESYSEYAHFWDKALNEADENPSEEGSASPIDFAGEYSLVLLPVYYSNLTIGGETSSVLLRHGGDDEMKLQQISLTDSMSAKLNEALGYNVESREDAPQGTSFSVVWPLRQEDISTIKEKLEKHESSEANEAEAYANYYKRYLFEHFGLNEEDENTLGGSIPVEDDTQKADQQGNSSTSMFSQIDEEIEALKAMISKNTDEGSDNEGAQQPKQKNDVHIAINEEYADKHIMIIADEGSSFSGKAIVCKFMSNTNSIDWEDTTVPGVQITSGTTETLKAASGEEEIEMPNMKIEAPIEETKDRTITIPIANGPISKYVSMINALSEKGANFKIPEMVLVTIDVVPGTSNMLYDHKYDNKELCQEVLNSETCPDSTTIIKI